MRATRAWATLCCVASIVMLCGWGINNPSGDIQPLGGASGGGSSTDPNAVHLTGAETITGVKTFTVAPSVPSASFPEAATTNLVSDLAAKATDSLTCHLAGTETITGAKTFSAATVTATHLNLTTTGGELSYGGNVVYESDGASTYLSPSNDTTGSLYVYTGGAQRAVFSSTGAFTLSPNNTVLGNSGINFGTDATGGTSGINAIVVGPVNPNSLSGPNTIQIGSGSLVQGGGDRNVCIGAKCFIYSGLRSVAVGSNAACASDRCVALGFNAGAAAVGAGQFSVSIGNNSTAYGTSTLSAGATAACGTSGGSQTLATCLGANTVNPNSYSTALGQGATVTADHQIMIGTTAEQVVVPGTGINLPGNANVAVIQLPKAGRITFGADLSGGNNVNDQAIMVGLVDPNNYAAGPAGQSYNFGGNATIIGTGAMVYAKGSADNNLAIGTLATVLSNPNGTLATTAFRNTVIGAQYASAEGFRNIAVGNGANASGTTNISMGDYAIVGDPNGVSGGSPPTYGLHQVQASVAIGKNAHVNNNFSVGLGANANTTADHQIMLGTSAEAVAVPGKLQNANGLVGAPTYTFSSDATSGAWLNPGTGLAFSYLGTQRLVLGTANAITGNTAVSGNMNVSGQVGSTSGGTLAAPGLYTSNTGASGLYAIGGSASNVVGFVTAGTLAGSIDASQNWAVAPASTNYLQLGGTTKLLAPASGQLRVTNSGDTAPTTLVSGVIIGTAAAGSSLVYDSTYGLRAMTYNQAANSGLAANAFTLTNIAPVNFGAGTGGGTETGMGFPSTTTLQWKTNGVVAGAIDASQNWTFAGNLTATGKTFTGSAFTAGTYNITGGAANTLISTTGTSLLLKTNNVNAMTIDANQTFFMGNGVGAGMYRNPVTGGLVHSNGTSTLAKADGTISRSYFIDTATATATVPAQTSDYIVSSVTAALTRNLPTPATSYVGQIVLFVQEGAHVLTVGVPAGVTATMTTGAGLTTTRVATNFTSTGTSGTDGTSASMVCTSTDGSTVATWRQISGLGYWN